MAAAEWLSAASGALFPRTDLPGRVDAIVVVAGLNDDRYIYTQHLAEEGVAYRILVSQPQSSSGRYATALDFYCASIPVLGQDWRRVETECFAPDVYTTERKTRSTPRSPTAGGGRPRE